jgi:hypothetical protein
MITHAHTLATILAAAPFRTLTLLALLALAGCAGPKGREFYEVNSDRERMRKGEPLKYHKDTIALSEHAMDLRMGLRAKDANKRSKVDLYGENPGPGGVVPAGGFAPGAAGGVQPAGGAYPAYPAGRTTMDYGGPDPTLK